MIGDFLSAPQLKNGSVGAWLGSLPNTYRICYAKADVAVAFSVAVASVKLRVKQLCFFFLNKIYSLKGTIDYKKNH